MSIVLTSDVRIGHVELASIDLVQKAIELSGTVVMGLPIRVQLTEAERNKQPSTSEPYVASSSLVAIDIVQTNIVMLYVYGSRSDLGGSSTPR